MPVPLVLTEPTEPGPTEPKPQAWLTAALAEKAKKYTILDPLTVNFVPRDDFLQGLAGDYELDSTAVSTKIRNGSMTCPFGVPQQLWLEIQTLAGYYDALDKTKARLPNFGRWCCSLYPKRPEFVEAFAKIGQASTSEKYTLTVCPIDILRCSDTTHFASCFKAGAFQQDQPKKVCEQAPGLSLALVDDDKGKVKRRTWVLHVTNEKGEHGLALYGSYGQADPKRLGKAIAAAKGIPVYMLGYVYDAKGKPEVLTAVNSFAEKIYFDTQVWGQFNGYRIEP